MICTASPNIIHMNKSRMRLVEHEPCTGERRHVYRVLVGDLRKRGHLEDLGIDGRTAKWIFKKWDGEAWTT